MARATSRVRLGAACLNPYTQHPYEIAGGLALVGTDRLSVDDGRGESFNLHRRFLEAGCVILEGLALADVTAGMFMLSATPLRFAGAEASPIRALLRHTEHGSQC